MTVAGQIPRWIVLGRQGEHPVAVALDDSASEISRTGLRDDGLAEWVASAEERWAPRWVWNDTPRWYGGALTAGARVGRCQDLRLCHVILRASALVRPEDPVRTPSAWDAPAEAAETAAPTLFDVDDSAPDALPTQIDDVLGEFFRQRSAIENSTDAGRLRLLVAAESAGALIAAELHAVGVPWDVTEHERILVDTLGPRPLAGGVPARMEDAARRVREALGDPKANVDSPPKLLRALHRAGVQVESTSRWELARQRHPIIEPLLEYKKLARLHSAHGWAWMAEWVRDGRFRPVYVPGGVVTGRWASSGGGALQVPRQLRSAMRADPGWVLVVADVAQLEPRVLAAMSRDIALAEAARGRDLYAGMTDRGAAETRAEAKIAMLGAMYGATTGDSGRLVPRLRRVFPRAMGLVDDAARAGEDGEIVTTWLGRSCPPPSSGWSEAHARAIEMGASGGQESRSRSWARARGRFTRNFVVQGTAAEWALAWLADLRGRLGALDPAARPAPRSGAAFAERAHVAFFLHDEVVVHAPREQAEAVAQATREAAAAAGRLLFGDFPLDFPLDLRIAQSAAKG